MEQLPLAGKPLLRLQQRPQVDIEFQDITYTVPQPGEGSKIILRNLSGRFQSGQLTAILGPSGSGKSTLLNILAGYKCGEATGAILINGKSRDMNRFGKMARYIMQEDRIQPLLTVEEIMLIAANLKIGSKVPLEEKLNSISEILEMLRLTGTKKTMTESLSGGEKKRLSIALELLNNPSVLFLDEPTTGLDDLSCAQCVSLLKQLAQGGRTVICSVHTPSAKIFSLFDRVFVMSTGQCAYQGYGPDVVPYLSIIGITCPSHYNPADFLIEICCGEYGDFQGKMVAAIDNGRKIYISDKTKSLVNEPQYKQVEDVELSEDRKCSEWAQFRILLTMMLTQMLRNKSHLMLKVFLYFLVGLLIGNLYLGMAVDGSKTLYNFGFYFVCTIFFMYVPMMPVLLSFPMQLQYLKREHFNQWYSLKSFLGALTISSLPSHIVLGTIYISLVYFLSYQPFEMYRLSMFYFVCVLTGIISESLGLMVSSAVGLINGSIVGPVITVPFMIFSVFGFGEGYSNISIIYKIAMHTSYLRYSMEAFMQIMLKGRPDLECPDTEDYCRFSNMDHFIKEMAMDNAILWVDIVALLASLLIFKSISYYLIKQRVRPNQTFLTIKRLVNFIKLKMGGSM